MVYSLFLYEEAFDHRRRVEQDGNAGRKRYGMLVNEKHGSIRGYHSIAKNGTWRRLVEDPHALRTLWFGKLKGTALVYSISWSIHSSLYTVMLIMLAYYYVAG